MRTEQPTKCYVPLQKLRARLAPLNMFKPLGNLLLTVPTRQFCCGPYPFEYLSMWLAARPCNHLGPVVFEINDVVS